MVFRGKEEINQLGLQPQAVLQAHLSPLYHGLFGRPDCQRGYLTKPLGPLLSRGEKLVKRDNPVHQPYVVRFPGVNALSKEEHLGCFGSGDGPGQPLGASPARDYPQLDFRDAKGGILSSDPQIAGQAKLKAATDSQPINGSDDGLPQLQAADKG